MIEVLIVGQDTDGELLEAGALLHGIPREGDVLSVWIGDGPLDGEVYLDVLNVAWPTWDGPDPTVHVVRADGYSDGEWRDIFKAISERRRP